MPWLGKRSPRLAILALTLYALLPIIRNTYTGIRGSREPAIVEAGRGMGLTDSQLLFSGGVAASRQRHSLRSARSHRDIGWPCHNCGGDRSRRVGRVYISRARHGRRSSHPGWSDPGCGAGTGRRRRSRLAGEAAAPTMSRLQLSIVAAVLATIVILGVSCESSRRDRVVVGIKEFHRVICIRRVDRSADRSSYESQS